MHQSLYFLGAAGIAVAAVSFVAGLEIPSARTGLGFDPQTVNRTLKGGRLPLVTAPSVENPAGQPALPNGCELRFSSTRNAYANEVAGRCVAEAPARSNRFLGVARVA